MSGERCPVCWLTPCRPDQLLHQVAGERQADGYIPCGCAPPEFTDVNPCIRGAEHRGMCVAEAPDLAPPFVQYGCRPDMDSAHPVAAG